MTAWVWPLDAVDAAVEALCFALGGTATAASIDGLANAPLAQQVRLSVARYGFEAREEAWWGEEVSAFVRRPVPAVVVVEAEDRTALGVVVVLGPASRGRVRVLTPAGRVERLRAADFRAGWRGAVEAEAHARAEALIGPLDLAGAEARRAQAALLRDQLRPVAPSPVFTVSRAAASPLTELLAEAGVFTQLGRYLGAYALELSALGVAWWSLGRLVFAHAPIGGAGVLFALALLTALVFRAVALAASGRVVILAGAVVKRRLMAGTLHVSPDRVRGEGAGRFLGRLFEASALENLALQGGLDTVSAVIDAVVVLVLATQFSYGELLALAWLLWLGVGAGLAAHLWRRQSAYAEARLSVANGLVERMVGHRTRVVQQPPARWADGEDEPLAALWDRARGFDGAVFRLTEVWAEGWLIVGLLAVAPAFVAVEQVPTDLAIGLGAVLLALRATQRLAVGLRAGAAVAVAWRVVKPLFAPPIVAVPKMAMAPPAASDTGPLVQVEGASFKYQPGGDWLFSDAALTVARGDRFLLEGRSGSGKSTFIAVLAGLLTPGQGLVLVRGLDRAVWGESQWRRTIGVVPQFHEDHIFSGTLAFNVLLSRGWPPTPQDMADAEAALEAVGLGPMLEKMPAGLGQPLGDVGWQVSHGERSRICICRALLQGAELLVLDESLGALDPQTHREVLAVVMDRAPALLVVAHP